MRTRLKIKEIAEAKSFSASRLSKTAGVHLMTIKHLFQNPDKDIFVSTLEKIANAMGVSIHALFEEVEESEQ